MASSVSTSLEEYSTEISLRGVLKKPESLSRRRTLTTLQTPSILHPMEDEQYGNASIPCLENLYKMIPDATFNSEQVRRLAEDVLHRNFKGVKYEAEKCKELVVKATEELKKCVKGLGCNRYKFVCVVYLGSLQSQGMAITSRCLLDERFDRCSTACYRNPWLYVVASIYGVFYE